jgi:hypothetical protein
MKNITLSIDEEILERARLFAVKRKTTVNGLVRSYLTELATSDDRTAMARRRLLELADKSEADMGEGYKWNREALYED